MLRPVEFNSAGNPRPGQTHQRRLDYPVIIDKIIVVGFIQCTVDPAADFRHNLDPHIFIFENDQLVVFIGFHIRDGLNYGMRIHAAGASLIHPFLQEHRIRICLSRLIRRNEHL
ncbi:hypothetical protein D3C80_1586510 [compost metagenome]